MTPCGILDVRQHWISWWLGAIRHQAIIWSCVDISSIRSHLNAFLEIMLWLSIYLKSYFKNESHFFFCRGPWVQLWFYYMMHSLRLFPCHWGWRKMAATQQTMFSKAFSWEKLLYFDWKFFLKGPTDNKSALLHTMPWHQQSDKSLPQSTLTNTNNAWRSH